LTLFTGYNGGGKSSAIQPLLLLAQGLRQAVAPASLALNGSLVSLGTAADVGRSDADSSAPNLVFTVATPEGEATWTLSKHPNSRSLHVDQALQQDRTAASCHLRRLSYVSAVRQGTSDAYPVPDASDTLIADVGADGRFAAYWYDQAVDDEVVEQRRHPDEPATSLRKQLDAWFAWLFPGARANVQNMPQIAQLCLQFQLSYIGAWSRPANVGFGLTYAFPILVALLVAQEGQVVVIDSPEAHLHPFAQSKMGRLLAQFAAAGVQILIETHSDHLLNGVRLAVKDKVLSHEAARIHFFTGATADGHGVISPILDAEGGVSEWPDGFFDQTEKDLSRLAGWT
jgi:predicted ATPase